MLMHWRAQRESNPCFRRERATSWTARRWARARRESGSAGWARCYKVGRSRWQACDLALEQSQANLEETMHAIRIDKPGGPEVMRLEEVELPPPDKGEVRLRQHAIGI